MNRILKIIKTISKVVVLSVIIIGFFICWKWGYPLMTNYSKILDEFDNSLIRTSELTPYLSAVAMMRCHFPEGEIYGSGILWNNDGVYSILTNDHVISDANSCEVLIEEESNLSNIYKTDYPSFAYKHNQFADIAILPLIERGKSDKSGGYTPILESQTIPLADLNYNISSMRKCRFISLGAPVVLIGYPASTMQNMNVDTILDPFYMASQSVTTGIISSFYEYYPNKDEFLYPNYFVSAKIDSGNSGGAAFSKDENGLCFLGIPTWLNIGNFDVQGIIQNANNFLPL